MSSEYRAICLSHNPGLEIESPSFHSSNDGRAALFGAIKSQAIEGHEDCDLVMGRYSYPLVELGCPGLPKCKYHQGPQWTDTDWIRLLDRSFSANIDVLISLFNCWFVLRLNMLRGLL